MTGYPVAYKLLERGKKLLFPQVELYVPIIDPWRNVRVYTVPTKARRRGTHFLLPRFPFEHRPPESSWIWDVWSYKLEPLRLPEHAPIRVTFHVRRWMQKRGTFELQPQEIQDAILAEVLVEEGTSSWP